MTTGIEIMASFKRTLDIFVLFVTICGAIKSSYAQTYCSLKVQVPGLNYCDASGLLEENIQSDVFRTLGSIEGIQDFQSDTFKLFDQQIDSVIAESESTDGSVRDIEEEIGVLQNFLTTIVNAEAYDTRLSYDNIARVKRANAPSQSQLQQSLDAAKLAFQQAVLSITNKLATLTKSVDSNLQQAATAHSKFVTDLNDHQLSLTTVEKQLTAIDADVQKLLTSSSGNKGPQGANLTSVTQEVTDLLINASVAEQLHQRQIDSLEKKIQSLENEEARSDPLLKSLNNDLSQLDTKIAKDDNSLSNTRAASRILEDKYGQFFYNATNDVAQLRADYAKYQQEIKVNGNQVVKDLIQAGQNGQTLKKARQEIDGVQSVVTFTQKLQLGQSGQILNLNKVSLSNVRLMKYAFGLLTSFP